MLLAGDLKGKNQINISHKPDADNLYFEGLEVERKEEPVEAAADSEG